MTKQLNTNCAENCIYTKHASATLHKDAAVQINSPFCDHSPISELSHIHYTVVLESRCKYTWNHGTHRNLGEAARPRRAARPKSCFRTRVSHDYSTMKRTSASARPPTTLAPPHGFMAPCPYILHNPGFSVSNWDHLAGAIWVRDEHARGGRGRRGRYGRFL